MHKSDKLLKILKGIERERCLDGFVNIITRQQLDDVIHGILQCHRNTTSGWIHNLMGLGILEFNPTSHLIIPKRQKGFRVAGEPKPEPIIMTTLSSKYFIIVEKLRAKINELENEKSVHSSQSSLLNYTVTSEDLSESSNPESQEATRVKRNLV